MRTAAGAWGIWMWAALAACDGGVADEKDTGAPPDELAEIDADADGVTVADGDCDDADATRFPGADDRVDARDQDCDGVDGVDADGDGVQSVASGGLDCDDAQAEIRPGAADPIVDGVDGDCDGVDGFDEDGDGVAGVAVGGTDCDDRNPGRSPLVVEACDGVDSDCDGVEATGRVSVLGLGTWDDLATAIEASREGDVLQICAGRYEGIFVIPHALTLRGAGRPEDTVLVGVEGFPVVESVASVVAISDLTLTHEAGVPAVAPEVPPLGAPCGGGLWAHGGGALALTDVIVAGNLADDGGGLCLETLDEASLVRVDLLDNGATGAGGLYAADVQAMVWSDLVIEANHGDVAGAMVVGGSLASDGLRVRSNGDPQHPVYPSSVGGIDVDTGSKPATFTDSELEANRGYLDGGARLWGQVTLTDWRSARNEGELTAALDVWDAAESGVPGTLQLDAATFDHEGGGYSGAVSLFDLVVHGGGWTLSGTCDGTPSPEGSVGVLIVNPLEDPQIADVVLRGGRCDTGSWMVEAEVPVTVSGLEVRDNEAPNAQVAFFTPAGTTLDHPIVTDNVSSADGIGSAVEIQGPGLVIAPVITGNQGVGLAAYGGAVQVLGGEARGNLIAMATDLALDLVDVTLVDNGSGVLADEGEVTLTRCEVRGNGGPDALFGAVLGAGVAATNTHFEDNEGDLGGAVWALGAAAFVDCTFEDNVAHVLGGAVHLGTIDGLTPGLLTAERTVFEDNRAEVGGALFMDGDAVLIDCAVADNEAGDGSGVFHMRTVPAAVGADAALRVLGGTVSGNRATGSGAIVVQDTTARFEGAMLSSNVSDGDGGAVIGVGPGTAITLVGSQLLGNDAGGAGGGVVVSEGSFAAMGSTFNGNSAGLGGAITAVATSDFALAECSLQANFAGDGGALAVLGPVGSATVAATAFFENVAGGDGAVVFAPYDDGGVAQLAFLGGFFWNNASLFGASGAIGVDAEVGADWNLTLQDVDLGDGPTANLPIDVRSGDDAFDLAGLTRWRCDADGCEAW
jgi:hypothetical protein